MNDGLAYGTTRYLTRRTCLHSLLSSRQNPATNGQARPPAAQGGGHRGRSVRRGRKTCRVDGPWRWLYREENRGRRRHPSDDLSPAVVQDVPLVPRRPHGDGRPWRPTDPGRAEARGCRPHDLRDRGSRPRTGMAAVLPRRIRDGRREAPSGRHQPARERARPERVVRHHLGKQNPTHAPRSLDVRAAEPVDEGTPLGARPTVGPPAIPPVVVVEKPNPRVRARDLRWRGRLPALVFLAGPQSLHDRPVPRRGGARGSRPTRT